MIINNSVLNHNLSLLTLVTAKSDEEVVDEAAIALPVTSKPLIALDAA